MSKCAMCVSVLLHSRTNAHSHLAGIAVPTPLRSHTGSHRPTAPCVPRYTISAFCVVLHCLCCAPHCTMCALLHCRFGQSAVGSGTPATHRHTAWRLWALELLQCSASLPGGQWVVQLLRYAASLLRGSGQWSSRSCCNALLLCLGAVGSGTPALHCLTAWGQWAVKLPLLLQCTASLPGGSGQRNPCIALPHCLGAVGSAILAIHCLTAWGQWAVELVQHTASLPGGSGQWNSCNAVPHCLGPVGSGTSTMHCLTT